MEFKYFFNCKACGFCCGYYSICVNLTDIYRLRYFTDISFTAMAETKSKKELNSAEHAYFKVGDDEKIIVLKKNEGSCIFLKNNKCSAHKYKPWVCLMYPLRYNEETGGYDVKFHDICKADKEREIKVKDFDYIKDLYAYEIEKNSELIVWMNAYAGIQMDDDFFNFLNDNYNETLDYLKETEQIFLKTRFL